MFTGEFNHTIDTKGRMIVPNKFRNILGEAFVISKSLDGCLSIYDKNKWDELEAKLNSLPFTDKRARELKRFILGSGSICETDRQGRILIPMPLRKSANLNQNVVLIGVGDHIEVWDEEMFNKNNDFSDYEKMAENMEGLNI